GDQVLATRARNLGTNDIEMARRQVIDRLPIGRMGTPTDIAKGIVFLASDDAAFMTGAGLVIDGGITAQSAERPASPFEFAVACRTAPSIASAAGFVRRASRQPTRARAGRSIPSPKRRPAPTRHNGDTRDNRRNRPATGQAGQ